MGFPSTGDCRLGTKELENQKMGKNRNQFSAALKFIQGHNK
jgi:hypothetical protein